jgi:hypothetical protein
MNAAITSLVLALALGAVPAVPAVRGTAGAGHLPAPRVGGPAGPGTSDRRPREIVVIFVKDGGGTTVGSVVVNEKGGVSIAVRDALLQDVLRAMHDACKRNVVMDPALRGKKVTLSDRAAGCDDAMLRLALATGTAADLDGNVWRFYQPELQKPVIVGIPFDLRD